MDENAKRTDSLPKGGALEMLGVSALAKRLAVATLVALLSACGGDERTTVPAVDTGSLGVALEEITRAGLKADVPAFGPVTAGTPLESVGLGDQDPEPGTRVPNGSTVHLRIGYSPIPTPHVDTRWPRWLVVPDFVGRSWPDVAGQLEGLWPVIVAVEALPASKSGDGLAAYVVEQQRPKVGARVPYGGVPFRGGWQPTTIRFWIAVR